MEINIININYFNLIVGGLNDESIDNFYDLIELLTERKIDEINIKDSNLTKSQMEVLVDKKLMVKVSEDIYSCNKDIWYVVDKDSVSIQISVPSDLALGDDFNNYTGGCTEIDLKVLFSLTLLYGNSKFSVTNNVINSLTQAIKCEDKEIYNSLGKLNSYNCLIKDSQGISSSVNAKVCHRR